MIFDPVEICAVLTEEAIDFVVLGGFAAIVHGSPLPTEDIDVIPSRDAENLERLATALLRLEAKIRTGDEPIETRIDAAFILNMAHMLNLVTRFGDMDLVFTPAGPLENYEQWLERSRRAELRAGLVVAVADLDDIIASKSAARVVRGVGGGRNVARRVRDRTARAGRGQRSQASLGSTCES